ncbi:MAG: thioredoxin [Candidatus Aminicenantes bacterium]|nr:thioredoxin [Candidatus Aminicenantes bacterium]
MSDSVLTITDDTFETEVIQSPIPVLLDFSAVWCVPCRMIAPVVDQLAVEYKDKLKVGKMDVDESPKTPAKFGIRGIPTLLLFKGGELKETLVGALPKDKIVAAFTKYL